MTDKCPHCNASLQGEPIPEKSREHYGDATHFRRVVAVYDLYLDRIVEWKCPDCDGRWRTI